MAGKGVARVVKRCDEAKEDKTLDLASCELCKFPDAVFMLMANTDLQICRITDNLIKRLPSKLGTKFTHLKELYLDNNKLTSLPDELKNISNLKVLDISENLFDALPSVVFDYNDLCHLNAENNSIKDVDVKKLNRMLSLSEVNLQLNPLTESMQTQLLKIKSFTVLLTPTDEHIDAVD